MRHAGLQEAQAGIKIAGRNINNLRYADDTTFMAEGEEELKSFLMKVKEESEKVGKCHLWDGAFGCSPKRNKNTCPHQKLYVNVYINFFS